jgi:hypothetical protein
VPFFEHEASEFKSLVRNSPQPGEPPSRQLTVQCYTVDAFCAEHHVSCVDVLKIDTEGWDLMVLRGSEKMHLFLVADRQYSCAYFETDGTTLDEAQAAKKRQLKRRIGSWRRSPVVAERTISPSVVMSGTCSNATPSWRGSARQSPIHASYLGVGFPQITVEHVHVHQGGQAIVGHVEHKREGGREKKGGSTPCKGD